MTTALNVELVEVGTKKSRVVSVTTVLPIRFYVETQSHRKVMNVIEKGSP